MGNVERVGRHHVWLGAIGLAASLLGVGCDAEDPESIGFRVDTLASGRTASGGGFINNGLHDPNVGGFDPDHSLDSNAGLDGSELDDPDRVATARYVVECALPEGESVSKNVGGQTVVFHGALGLAPEWQDDECDVECQEWVSACVLARTNVSGQTVSLWLKGDHPELGFGSNVAYPHHEASFFGNLFAGPGQAYVCPGQASGTVIAKLQGRTCSNGPGGWCGFTSYSGCHTSTRCEIVGNAAQPTAVDCRAGATPSGAPMRTISTYVGTSG